MRIWKYEIRVSSHSTELMVPGGARLLPVAKVPFPGSETLFIWAEVDSSAEYVPRSFRVFGTGYTVLADLPLEYVATAFDPTYELVWHVYEEKR